MPIGAAPPSVIPDLIALLADPEAEVRFHSATALHRLTGQTLGASPEQCSAEDAQTLGQTQRKWQAWWEESEARGRTRPNGRTPNDETGMTNQ